MSSSSSSDDGPSFAIRDKSMYADSSSDESSGVVFVSAVANVAASVHQARRRGSSSKKTRNYVYRDREAAERLLIEQYFVADPVFGHDKFRRRFRMSLRLFNRIVTDMEREYDYFKISYDAARKRGFSALQKCTSAIRQLAEGCSSDTLDEYLYMSERVSLETLQHFCYGVIQLYGKEYMRRPTSNDLPLLYAAHESIHGFPGMLGSIDCTHWNWRNCPTAWRGQYMRGDHEYPTIILEAVASQDTWIWHSYFGMAGSHNDLNVLYQSPIFNPEELGTAPPAPFTVNNQFYQRGYYLVDGIYPDWASFVKTISYPTTAKKTRFKRAQESARKDVERAFGVIKARWGIIQKPLRLTTVAHAKEIMYACLILHNMILQDEGRAICPQHDPDLPTQVVVNDDVILEIRDSATHHHLHADLVDHIEVAYIPKLDD